MAVWSTCAGFERRPRPKNMTSPGWRSSIPMRSARGTSPLISIVVRPRSTPVKSPFLGIGRQLVHAPDEAGAVEAGRALAGAAPDVRVADVGERGRDDPPLPRRQL